MSVCLINTGLVKVTLSTGTTLSPLSRDSFSETLMLQCLSIVVTTRSPVLLLLLRALNQSNYLITETIGYPVYKEIQTQSQVKNQYMYLHYLD